MSLIYLITSLPLLKRNSHSEISQEGLWRHIIKSGNQGLKNEIGILRLLDEIEKKYLSHASQNIEQICFTGIGEDLWRVFFDKKIESLFIQRKFHCLKRKWYDFALEKSRSQALQEWLSFSLDFESVTAAINCRKQNIKQEEFLEEFEDAKDFVGRQVKANPNSEDFGLSKRFYWYDDLKRALVENRSFESIERVLNGIKWKFLSKIKTTNLFSIDFIVVYFLELQIILREEKFNDAAGQKHKDK